MAKRRKKRQPDESEIVRIEPQPAREIQQEWAGLFVPYIYCPECRHVYSPDELNKFDWAEPLALPELDEEGRPEGAQDLKMTCRRCRKARLLRILVDFGKVEPYRVGGKKAAELGIELFLCICPLCGGACQVRRSRDMMRATEQWHCTTCNLNLQRAWM